MASLAKIFGGILLIVAGTAIIYGSSLYHLIELINIFGIILIIMGVCLIIFSFFKKDNSKNPQNFKNNSDDNNKIKKLDSGVGSRNNSLKKENNTTKKGNVGDLGNNLTNSKLNSLDTKKFTNKVKNVSKSTNPKTILKPIISKPNENVKKFKFTPNYEKPMKVNRRPQRRNKSNLNNIDSANKANKIDNKEYNKIKDLNNLKSLPGKKSEKIAIALASDDFIRPIHNEPKNNFSHNIRNNQEYVQNSLWDDESRDFTTDDLEDENINNINNNTNNNNNPNDIVNNNLKSELSSLDINEPSKFLSSYVVCSKGTMTSKEAFDELAKSAKSKMFLEMTSIKDMTNGFLSKISSLDMRIIIQEFDIKDMAYILLITSLLERGAKIRTLPIVNSINLIADDSHALIISENDSSDDLDIGAVYNDSKSISNVKSMFENSWNIADPLDINNIGKNFD